MMSGLKAAYSRGSFQMQRNFWLLTSTAIASLFVGMKDVITKVVRM